MAIPNLTPPQLERLAVLSEEMGEVQQVVGKILRHGYESYNPFDELKTTNRVLLEKELADLQCAMSLLFGAKDLSIQAVDLNVAERFKSKYKYLHHQKSNES